MPRSSLRVPRSPLLWRLGAAFLLALGGGGSATAVHAQAGSDAAPPQRVTLAAVGVPLQEALEVLIDRTRIDLVYDNALVAGRTAYCRTERAPVEQALACVLRGTGLDYARLSSGTYTLLHAEAAPRWGNLTGEVVDAETGAPLAGAHVVLAVSAADEAPGTAANAAGRFALPRLLPGTRRLVITHVGYRRAEVTVDVGPAQTGRVAIALEPEPVLAAPVVVSGLERRALSERLGAGRIDAPALTNAEPPGSDALVAASVAATPDVTQALAAVVGVRSGEALADVHVQGGAAGEHALLLDGAPVLVPVTLGGLVGPFSPFALARVVVHKAGYGAPLGSHLAGVVAAESAVTPPSGEALAVQADPLSLNARWGGRAGRPAHVEGAWALTVRRGLWGTTRPAALADRLRSWSTPDAFLIEQLGQEAVPPAPNGYPVELGFTDAHAAGRLRFGGLRSLHGSLYLARHAFGVEDTGPDDTPADDLYEDAYRWRNATGQLRYEWVQGDRAFAHVGAWTSGYRLRRPSALAGTGGDLNAVRATGVRAGLDLAAGLVGVPGPS
ncbi:MAG: carboxypeptidase regulatory-like domain-containing protein, partial [Rhodothermales bacterium]|nr:carboxypeptidase regulatory-like domain-containing protein [Rhodothermales bacterium]